MIRVAGKQIRRKSDVPPLPPSGKPAWVCIADPLALEVRLQKASKEGLMWLAACYTPQALASSAMPRCTAAAGSSPASPSAAGTALPLFESDNTAAEAGCNKLFTTSWPLRLVASWCYARNVSLMVSHVPDELSRNQLARFSHKPELRMRFTLTSLRQLCHCTCPQQDGTTASWQPRDRWPRIRKSLANRALLHRLLRSLVRSYISNAYF